MPGTDTQILLGANCEAYPFTSTLREAAPWSSRVGPLAERIAGSGASVVCAQEVGQAQAAQLAAALGDGWAYQRCILNTVLWRTETWDLRDPSYDNQSRDLPLPAYGQAPGRSAIACRLVEVATGRHFYPISTHLTVGKAGVTPLRARAARRTQARNIAAKFGGYGAKTCLIVGDFNERGELGGPRTVLAKQGGFRFLELSKADQARDPHHGIDAVGAQAGIQLLAHGLVPFGRNSDHDGQLVRWRFTHQPDPA